MVRKYLGWPPTLLKTETDLFPKCKVISSQFPLPLTNTITFVRWTLFSIPYGICSISPPQLSSPAINLTICSMPPRTLRTRTVGCGFNKSGATSTQQAIHTCKGKAHPKLPKPSRCGFLNPRNPTQWPTVDRCAMNGSKWNLDS